ncbi:hypothetical protein [uncultured Desulfobulbus sp.]|uniref:hypothetical protein n=1 Tax=uncultured Desulfobulbus sp. TaxID=239745 RepID=UPI0029C8F203|nr:hypothetical protein [uncultured Desulfobulbus sp.]
MNPNLTSQKEVKSIFNPFINYFSSSDDPNKDTVKLLEIKHNLDKKIPVLISFSKKYLQKDIKKYIEGNFSSYVGRYYGSNITRVLGDVVHGKMLRNCVLLSKNLIDKQVDQKKWHEAYTTVVTFLRPKICQYELNDWVLVVDESGNLLDHHSPAQDKSNPSVMIAVLIPPQSNLPFCPIGYHGAQSAPATSRQLRNNLIENEEIAILSWKYNQADPYRIKVNAKEGLHLQMWLHALTLSLEYIAQKSHLGPKTVWIYIENVLPYEAHSQVLIGDIRRLLDSVHKRKGWCNLTVMGPTIVRKDEHPWLGYADCLGRVFDTYPSHNSFSELELFEQIKNRKNTFSFPYTQKVLQEIHSLIEASYRSPDSTLRSLANLDEETFRTYGSLLLPVTIECLNRITPPEKESLIKHLNENLTDKPRCYYASSIISRELHKDGTPLTETMAAIAEMNQFLACNRTGDVEQAVRLNQYFLTNNIDSVSRPLAYRFIANVIDCGQNKLEFDETEQLGEKYREQCMSMCKDIETAAHCLGGHMQTLAHIGKTTEALKLWGKIYPLQSSIAARVRYLAYKIHLLYDLEKYETAVNLAKDIPAISGVPTLSDASYDNPYLAVALLKLYKTKPFLDEDTLIFITQRIPVPKSFPGMLLLFWQVQIEHNKQQISKDKLTDLKSHFAQKQPCEALELIAACLEAQLAMDGIIDNIAHDEIFTQHVASFSCNVRKRLNSFPVKLQEKLGYLNPLRFNFR